MNFYIHIDRREVNEFNSFSATKKKVKAPLPSETTNNDTGPIYIFRHTHIHTHEHKYRSLRRSAPLIGIGLSRDFREERENRTRFITQKAPIISRQRRRLRGGDFFSVAKERESRAVKSRLAAGAGHESRTEEEAPAQVQWTPCPRRGIYCTRSFSLSTAAHIRISLRPQRSRVSAEYVDIDASVYKGMFIYDIHEDVAPRVLMWSFCNSRW